MKNKQEIIIPNLGTLNFIEGNWFGRIIPSSGLNQSLELSICVNDSEESIARQIDLVIEFVNNIDLAASALYNFMSESFQKSGDVKTVDELKGMYSVSSITLKENLKDWWIVFEPNDVESKYNFLPRFTLNDLNVTWSNIN